MSIIKEIEISDTIEYLQFIKDPSIFPTRTSEHTFLSQCYRGQPDSTYKLIPSFGRLQPNCKSLDLDYTDKWVTQAKSLYNTRFPESFIDTLVFAQHHGLPTRLLDWTLNPLAALFFACISNNKNENQSDGAVYVCLYVNSTITTNETFESMLEISKKSGYMQASFYIPKQPSIRSKSQSGIVSIHFPPDINLIDTDWQLIKIIIPSLKKKTILSDLDSYGINYHSIFPDFEGITKHFTNFMKNFGK